MSSKPPGADFYDRVFANSSAEQQASFLKALFIKDASLRSSYQYFISPPYFHFEDFKLIIDKRSKFVQNKIIKYDWSKCFEIDPLAEDYDDIIIEILEREILSDLFLTIPALCRIGLLTEAIADIRIMEKALDLDWERLPEPLSFTKYLPDYFFEMAEGSFLTNICDYVYAPAMINDALELIALIKREGRIHPYDDEIWDTIASSLRVDLKRL